MAAKRSSSAGRWATAPAQIPDHADQPTCARHDASHEFRRPVAPWRFQLDELSLTNFQVSFEDHSTLGVATLGLDDLTLNLKGLSNQTNTPIDLAVGFNWRGGGAGRVVTHGTPMPPDLTTTLLISNLAIAPVQPYLRQQLNLVVHSGELNVQGAATVNPAATRRFISPAMWA